MTKTFCDVCGDEITEAKKNDGFRRVFKLGNLIIQTIPCRDGLTPEESSPWNGCSVCVTCVRNAVTKGTAYEENDTAQYAKSGKSLRRAAQEKADAGK